MECVFWCRNLHHDRKKTLFLGKEDSSKDDKSSEAGSEQSEDSTKSKKSKKKVRWAAEKSLFTIHYIEMFENERGIFKYLCQMR